MLKDSTEKHKFEINDNNEEKYFKSPKNSINTNTIKDVCGIRHVLAIMTFLTFVCIFAMRVNLSVAIVAMVKKHTEEHISNENKSLESCPQPQIQGNFGNISPGEFSWDKKTQGLILGSFYYSYGIGNLIGGRASYYFGGRELVGVGTLATAILTLLTPLAARTGVGFLVGVRVLEGCFQGLTFPAASKLITKWYTTNERSKFTGIIFAGVDIGSVIAFSTSGWLCESEFFGGWPSVFYVPGIFSIIFVIFWFLLVRNDPKNHPWITEEELKYIVEGTPTSEERRNPIPWASIIRSKPLWANVIAHLGANFGYYVLLCELPTYLDNVLHISLNRNGVMSSLPYLAAWAFSVIYSVSVDKAISSGRMTILAVRRLSVAISCYGPMLCLIGMCFVDCSIGGAFTILLISGALNGAAYCGFFASYSDLAPRYTGTLMGLGTALGCLGGIGGPAITGAITEGNAQFIPAWRIVFIVCAIIYLITTTIYEIFITTKIQPWNEQKTSIINGNETGADEKFL